VLVWNDRRTRSTPFLEAYEKLLLAFATDYTEVNHKLIGDEEISAFYRPGAFRRKTFENKQEFDLEGLRGRLLSSSYTPQEGHPNYAPMLVELASIFERHQVGGRVSFEYDTVMYYGQLPSLTLPP
jgi:hypothetical protein